MPFTVVGPLYISGRGYKILIKIQMKKQGAGKIRPLFPNKKSEA
jgi:hypothetical protein